jgi:Tol biopolymer transport system component
MVDGYPEDRSAVYIVRRNGTGARRLHKRPNGYGPAWSADGQLIAFNRRGSVSVIAPDGARLRTVRHDVNPHQLDFSPSGRKLVFRDLATRRGAVRVLDLPTGRLSTIPETALGGRPGGVTWTPDGRRLAFLLPHWVTDGPITRVDAVELYTIRPNGTARRQLATLRQDVMSWEGLSWGP